MPVGKRTDPPSTAAATAHLHRPPLPPRPRVTGVVLAGGAARRLGGVPKGLLEVGSRRLIDRVLDALSAASDALLIVANDPAAGGWAPGIPVCADLGTERGALAGVRSALAKDDAALVVAWDLPFVNAQLLRALRTLGETHGSAALPESDRGLEPLCAYYPASVRAIAEALLASGERRVSAFVDRLDAAGVLGVLAKAEVSRYGDPARLFLNVNTPADLAMARRLAGVA